MVDFVVVEEENVYIVRQVKEFSYWEWADLDLRDDWGLVVLEFVYKLEFVRKEGNWAKFFDLGLLLEPNSDVEDWIIVEESPVYLVIVRNLDIPLLDENTG